MFPKMLGVGFIETPVLFCFLQGRPASFLPRLVFLRQGDSLWDPHEAGSAMQGKLQGAIPVRVLAKPTPSRLDDWLNGRELGLPPQFLVLFYRPWQRGRQGHPAGSPAEWELPDQSPAEPLPPPPTPNSRAQSLGCMPRNSPGRQASIASK